MHTSSPTPTRTLVVWCPDWPLTAAGIPAEQPAAILASERVAVCSAAARAEGVHIGQRRREALACCPDLQTLAADPAQERRVFGAVVTAAQHLVPVLEVIRPGLLALAVRGPAKAVGGEQQAAEHLTGVVDETVAQTADMPTTPTCRTGIADTRFAAVLAARRAPSAEDAPLCVVPPGEDAAFLAPLPVTTLRYGTTPSSRQEATAYEELVELLGQLGIRTLGQLAALPAASVTDRFGVTGGRAHRLARGEDDHQLVPAELSADLQVSVELEEPAAQVEAVAFAVRKPAERLITKLRRSGQSCTLLEIAAETEHAEQLTRHWRTSGFTPGLVVDRVRWQLDGWLSGSARVAKPTAGIVMVRLDPIEVVSGGHQQNLLDAATAPNEAITQAVTRLQGMLGPDAVLVSAPAGGRDPSRWVAAVPWDQRDTIGGLSHPERDRPWPGRLPSPAPATVLPRPQPAQVTDHTGVFVKVSGRGVISAAPAQLQTGSGPWQQVTGWAGPWPADERWWDSTGRRRARFQVTTEDGAGFLLALEDSRWWVEAIYD